MVRLYDYRLELIRTHPGSTIVFKCDQGIFQCMYVCLTPLREGFLGRVQADSFSGWMLFEGSLWRSAAYNSRDKCKSLHLSCCLGHS